MMKSKDKMESDSLGSKTQTVSNPLATEKPKRKTKYRSTTARAATRKKIEETARRKRAARAAEEIEAAKARIAAAPPSTPEPALTRKERKLKTKEEKRAERQRADLTRGSALARLLIAGRIDKRMYEAGAHLRHLWVSAMPGASAVDFTRPKVDGGGRRGDGVAVGMLHADMDVKRLILASGVGDDAAEVLQLLCRDDMMPTPIAIMIEDDEAARRAGQCTRDTQAVVRFLLRSGLSRVWNTMNRRSAAREGAATMRAWLAEDARPRIEETRLGKRDDLAD